MPGHEVTTPAIEIDCSAEVLRVQVGPASRWHTFPFSDMKLTIEAPMSAPPENVVNLPAQQKTCTDHLQVCKAELVQRRCSAGRQLGSFPAISCASRLAECKARLSSCATYERQKRRAGEAAVPGDGSATSAFKALSRGTMERRSSWQRNDEARKRQVEQP